MAANLIEPSEHVLLLYSGYFGDGFRDWQVPFLLCDGFLNRNYHLNVSKSSLETYGANVTVLKAEIGLSVSQPAIEEALKTKQFKALVFTHVDTSTGTLESQKTRNIFL